MKDYDAYSWRNYPESPERQRALDNIDAATISLSRTLFRHDPSVPTSMRALDAWNKQHCALSLMSRELGLLSDRLGRVISKGIYDDTPEHEAIRDVEVNYQKLSPELVAVGSAFEEFILLRPEPRRHYGYIGATKFGPNDDSYLLVGTIYPDEPAPRVAAFRFVGIAAIERVEDTNIPDALRGQVYAGVAAHRSQGSNFFGKGETYFLESEGGQEKVRQTTALVWRPDVTDAN